jgi:hypothetical protein
VLSAKLILTALPEHEVSHFEQVIMADKWWFLPYHSRSSFWVLSHGEFPHRIRQSIDAEKCLASILWLINGIHSIFDVAKWTECKTAFFTNFVIPNFIQNITSRNQKTTMKGRVIHMDSARPHNPRSSQNHIGLPKPNDCDIEPISQTLFRVISCSLTIKGNCLTRIVKAEKISWTGSLKLPIKLASQ